MSNISCDSIGKVILQDISSRSVARAECKSGAALLASSVTFFQQLHHEIVEMQSSSWLVAFYSYRQDATNERRKRSTLELHTGYVTPSEYSPGLASWDEDGASMTRLSDVLPISDETAQGTLGFTIKALKSLGCPCWNDVQEWNNTGILRRRLWNKFLFYCDFMISFIHWLYLSGLLLGKQTCRFISIHFTWPPPPPPPVFEHRQ